MYLNSLVLISLQKSKWIVFIVLIGIILITPVAYNRTPNLFDGELKLENHSPKDFDDRKASGTKHDVDVREGRKSDNGKWMPFGPHVPFEGYVYSAFYDDRKSLASLPVIRVVAVMENVISPSLYCLLYYKAGNKMEHIAVFPTEIGTGMRRHNTYFVEYVLTCALIHEEVPDKIGIVRSRTAWTDFLIPVEIPERPIMPSNFGVCISVSYWKQDPHHIVEWLELLRIMGVSGVTVYNNSLEYESARIFQEYAKEGFVDFRQSHNFIKDGGELTIHMHMSPVINDCMYRNMYKYRKIIVTDFDEVIVPRSVLTYHDMLTYIDKFQTPNNQHPARHYIFRNNYFFIDIPGEDTSQSKHLTTLRHRKKVPVSGFGYSSKSIIDPLSCRGMHNHYCWKSTVLYANGKSQIDVQPEYAVNQHYKACHLDKWENKAGKCKELFKEAVQDDIMLRFKPKLEKQVRSKLAALNLGDL